MPGHTSIPKMIHGIRRIMRARAYSPRTEAAYVQWIERFLRFHDRPHWRDLGEQHAQTFLTSLEEEDGLAPKSRNQAASALAFLYREVLGSDAMDGVKRAREPQNEAVHLSNNEAHKVLAELRGKYRILAGLMYGSGLRVEEALSLRVKDLDFELEQILVRRGKGAKDRFVQLPRALSNVLKTQVRDVAALHREDRRSGGGWAALPGALHRKDPGAGFNLRWQFVFPASRWSPDPKTNRRGRWHLHNSALQREIKKAVIASGIAKNATSHSFRHSYGTQIARAVPVDVLMRLMGHKDVRTTLRYMHNAAEVGVGVESPLDRSGPTEPLFPASPDEH
jgi:integron integrase